MPNEPKNYERLIGELKGALSEQQLRNHFTLYQGYVKKLNEIEDRLGRADRGSANYSFGEYSDLRRREPVAYNGTVLHELYFDNLGSEGGKMPAGFEQGVRESFGSVESWVDDLKACVGSAHGWTLSCYDFNFKKIRNVLVQSEHHVGILPNTLVLLAIDCWEHAYFMDFGTRKPDYFAAVMKHINYRAVEQRLTMTPLGSNSRK